MHFPPFDHAAWLGEAWRHGPPRHDLGASGFRSPRIASALPPVLAEDAAHMDLHSSTALRAALAKHLGRPEDEVRATAGTTAANAAAVMAYYRHGSTVVCERPTYMPLAGLATALGATISWIDRTDDGALDADRMAAVIDGDTSLVLLTSPNNPAGSVASAAQLETVAAAAQEAGAMVVVDQVYAELQDAPMIRHPNVISTGGLNKCWGAPGLRIGWATGSREAMAEVETVTQIISLAVPAYGARAATSILGHQAAFAKDLASHLGQAHVLYRAWCEDMGVPHTGAGLTAFPRIGGDTLTIARALAKDGILTVPGEMFGRAGHLRLGFGGSIQGIEDALAALQAGLRAQRF